jgi:hypothetical protein
MQRSAAICAVHVQVFEHQEAATLAALRRVQDLVATQEQSTLLGLDSAHGQSGISVPDEADIVSCMLKQLGLPHDAFPNAKCEAAGSACEGNSDPTTAAPFDRACWGREQDGHGRGITLCADNVEAGTEAWTTSAVSDIRWCVPHARCAPKRGVI